MTYQDIIKNINILLVDDNQDYLNMTLSFLKQRGYNVDIANCGTEALKRLEEKNYHILLVDFYMTDMTGEEVISKIREENKELIIIIQTGFAGQIPPAEMMKKLAIQNYFDKTEGIEKLDLEIISAVRIVNQQNEIEIAKCKNVAMGEVMTSIAQEVKQVMLTVGGAIEAANLLDSQNPKVSKLFENSQKSLERLDKVISAVLTASNSDTVISDEDTLLVIDSIVFNIAKLKNIVYESKLALKNSGYFSGNINDMIFIVALLIKQTILVSDEKVEFVITDDEEKVYFKIRSKDAYKIDRNSLYTVSKAISILDDVSIEEEKEEFIISKKK